MPQFEPNDLKAAVAPIRVSPSGLSCQAELFLGPDDITKVATSGLISFASTGSQQSVILPVDMPATPGTYHVYLDVYVGDMLLFAYIATEDVVIAVPSPLLPELQDSLVDWTGKIDPYKCEGAWWYIPVYGLYDMCTAGTKMQSMMVTEAINRGLIGSATAVYFEGGWMYYVATNNLVVPHSFSCPYCTAVFDTPKRLAAHMVTHPPVAASITMIPDFIYDWDIPTGFYGMTVRWLNKSSIPIKCHVYLTSLGYYGGPAVDVYATSGQDSTVLPNGFGSVYFPTSREGTYVATLVCLDPARGEIARLVASFGPY